MTNARSLLVAAQAQSADIQDRDGAPPLFAAIRSAFPWLRYILAYGGYAGEKLNGVLASLADRRWRPSSDPTR